MNSKNPKARPKPQQKSIRDGKVYGDALSAQEKKKIVMQKKKDKKAKKIAKSAQQTITANRNAAIYGRSGCTKNRENIHKSMTAAGFSAFLISCTDETSAPFRCCMILL